uniref:PAP-associated domain-containing protein n=1 Tax=Strongyloides stercoralis TaxID=6248 RepID=A0A913HEZ2_STRER
MNLNLQTTIIQFNSTNTPHNHFDNRNEGSDSGMHTNSTSSASSNDGDPKRLESLSNVTVQDSILGHVEVSCKPASRLPKWSRSPKNSFSKRQLGYNNRRNKYSYSITPVQQFYADLPVSEDLKYQLLNGFRRDSNIPHCHLGLPPLPIQPPLFYHYHEIVNKAKEMYNHVIEQYPITNSKVLEFFYKHMVDENPLLHYYPNKKYFECLDTTSHFYNVENFNQPCYFYEGSLQNQYNIPPPKIENLTDVGVMKYTTSKVEEKNDSFGQYDCCPEKTKKINYPYHDDKCINYSKNLKKEKSTINFKEDNLKEQHMAKCLPMVMSYKEAVQNTNDFELPHPDISVNMGIPSNVVSNDQYFFQPTHINGFVPPPNPVSQNCNNSQYSLPLNLPNYQPSLQLPSCCNTVPQQYAYVQECDPHNNKNAAAIQSLCFMFLEDCKTIDKNRPAVTGKFQQPSNSNGKGLPKFGFYSKAYIVGVVGLPCWQSRFWMKLKKVYASSAFIHFDPTIHFLSNINTTSSSCSSCLYPESTISDDSFDNSHVSSSYIVSDSFYFDDDDEECNCRVRKCDCKVKSKCQKFIEGECGYYTEGGSQPTNTINIKTPTNEDVSYSEEDLNVNTSQMKQQVKAISPLEGSDFSQLTHVKDEITSTSYLSLNDSESRLSFDKDRKKYFCNDKESQYLFKSSESNKSNPEKDEKNKENNVNWEQKKQDDVIVKKNRKNKSPEQKENNRPKGQALVYNIGLQQNQSNFSENLIHPGIDSTGKLFISQMDSLSERIFDFHTTVMQSQAHLNRKLYLRDMIYYTICPLFPTSGLYIVGSSLNGFGNNGSDMDLCLMLTNKELDQRRDAVAILNAIKTKMSSIDWIRDLHLIVAKVPILRITFNAPFSNITVDLNANNSVAIKNTHLLCAYSNFDWRVRPLVSAVKEWAKRRGINDANQSTFTSYSLVLMCLHYLQCGLDVPILPSLQELYQDRFNNKCDVRNLNVVVSLEKPNKEIWPYESKATLGELLIGFLKYYAEIFDFENDVISIRCGKRLSRKEVMRNDAPHNSKSQWGCVCIEEPFTLMNTAHSVFDSVVFEAIKKCFVETYEHLKNTSDFDVFLSGRSIKDVLGGYTLIPPGGVIYNAPRQNGTNQLTSNASMVYSSPEISLSNSSQEESSNEFNTNTSEILSDNSISKSSSLDEIGKKTNRRGGSSSSVSKSKTSFNAINNYEQQKIEDNNGKKNNGNVSMALKTGHIDITEFGLAPINGNKTNIDELNMYGKCNSNEKNNTQGTLTEQNKIKNIKKEDLNISNFFVRGKGKHHSKKGTTNNVDDIKCTIEN